MPIKFDASMLLEIATSRDLKVITNNDRNISLALYGLSKDEHPQTLSICYQFSKIPDEGHQFLESIETAVILIEDVLDTDIYTADALELLDSETDKERLCSPLWLFLARSNFRTAYVFRNYVISSLKKNPSFFADVMEKTRDSSFIDVLEGFLKQHVQFVKYLPMGDDSYEIFPPHDVWLRVGGAYVRLVRHAEGTMQGIDDQLEFLEKKFFSHIPATEEKWLKQADATARKSFHYYSEIYWDNFVVFKT